MTKEIVVRNGFVKFWRVGPLSFGDQKYWSHAPAAHGMWAFPWPFFEPFFVQHRYLEVMPKRFWGTDNEEEAEQWLKTVAKRVVPVREFWYRGDVYSKISSNRHRTVQVDGWLRMDATEYAKAWRVNGYNRLYETAEDGRSTSVRTTVDLMEVFIAPRDGIIRSTPR